MVRPRDDEDILEPILPKHPPYQRDEPDADASPATSAPAPRGRPSWDRLVLVGCAVVATLALVVVALRVTSIADDERIQTCQIRVYAAEQSGFADGGRDSGRRLARELAECVGIEPEVDEETD